MKKSQHLNNTDNTEGSNNTSNYNKIKNKKFSCLGTFIIALVVCLVTILLTLFIIFKYIFPNKIKQIKLSKKEKITLNNKLEEVNLNSEIFKNTSSSNRNNYLISENYENKNTNTNTNAQDTNNNRVFKAKKFDPTEEEKKWMIPGTYKNKQENRIISFTQREINGLISENNDLAGKLAINFDNDLVSAKSLLPIPEDFPIFGGKNLRINAGIVLNITPNGEPILIFKGINIMGVEIPNAWLGGLKNINLAQHFKNNNGILNSFLKGIKQFEIKNNSINLELKE